MRKGTSLIELLLYLALSSTLLLGITTWSFLSQAAAVRNRAINTTELVGNHILAHIERALESSLTVINPVAGASSSTVSLSMAAAGVNPTVIALSGNNLTITEGAGSAVRLNPDHVRVTGFTVTNITGSGAADTVRLQLTLETGATANRREFKLTRTFYLTAGSKQ